MPLGDFFGDWRLNSIEGDLTKVEASAQAAQDDLHTLRVRLDRLALVCSAMWELLQEKTGVTSEDLAQRIQQIDLRDGHADGKIGTRIRTCPHCHHANSPAVAKCIYCGAQLPTTDILTT
jgi:hypothetical protein